MNATASDRAGILCVDDNVHVAEALRLWLAGNAEFEWRGWLTSADDLVETGEREQPDVVLLDVDMPGRDPFEAAAELVARCPQIRVVVFSGHVRGDLIERALGSGAWGYVSKNDGEVALFDALERVRRQEVAFSPEAQAIYDRL